MPRNMYDYQRERMKSELGVNDEALCGRSRGVGEVALGAAAMGGLYYIYVFIR